MNNLSKKKLYVINHLQYSFNIREISRRLGRHHSTISRAFWRAKNRPPWTTGYYDGSHSLARGERAN
ncbi:MAG: helix-turn-helix domain-containing protein [Desulfuromonadaceae bacterium]|nr:helix-turn-helix domain-containing protein [Desulfuromonadaceae bacterium]